MNQLFGTMRGRNAHATEECSNLTFEVGGSLGYWDRWIIEFVNMRKQPSVVLGALPTTETFEVIAQPKDQPHSPKYAGILRLLADQSESPNLNKFMNISAVSPTEAVLDCGFCRTILHKIHNRDIPLKPLFVTFIRHDKSDIMTTMSFNDQRKIDDLLKQNDDCGPLEITLAQEQVPCGDKDRTEHAGGVSGPHVIVNGCLLHGSNNRCILNDVDSLRITTAMNNIDTSRIMVPMMLRRRPDLAFTMVHTKPDSPNVDCETHQGVEDKSEECEVVVEMHTKPKSPDVDCESQQSIEVKSDKCKASQESIEEETNRPCLSHGVIPVPYSYRGCHGWKISSSAEQPPTPDAHDTCDMIVNPDRLCYTSAQLLQSGNNEQGADSHAPPPINKSPTAVIDTRYLFGEYACHPLFDMTICCGNTDNSKEEAQTPTPSKADKIKTQ